MMSQHVWPNWLTQQLQDIGMQHLPSELQSLKHAHRDIVLQQGLPNASHERWKYTDLSLLQKQEFNLAKQKKTNLDLSALLPNSIQLSLENGILHSHSDIDLPIGAVISSLSDAIAQHHQLVMPYLLDNAQIDAFASLNTALFTDGLFIYLPENCELALPIHVLIANATSSSHHPHTIIVLGKNSKLSLIEEYQHAENQACFNNVFHKIYLNEQASLHYNKIQNESNEALHFANMMVEQADESHFNYVNISLGSRFARDDVKINLRGARAHCHASSFSLLTRKEQYIDHHIDIQHLAPNTESHMLYKAILNEKSRTVFNGRLYVAEKAQKISAQQANHNILLSKTAEAYSKPELEIYADDVKCKHGATTGQLDESALFYLRARGINKEEAIKMLIESFAAEIVTQLQVKELRARIQEAIT